MPMTLAEAMKAPGATNIDPQVVNIFEQTFQMFNTLPFRRITGLVDTFWRHKTVGTPAARPVNPATRNVMQSEREQVMTPLKPLWGDIDVDNMISDQAPDAVAADLDAGTIGALSEWQRQLFYGDSSTNTHEIDGLINKVGSAQTIDAGSTSGGDPLSVRILDRAIMECLRPTHIIMSQAMLRNLTAYARVSSNHQLQWPLGVVGNQLPTWGGIPILTPKDHDGQDVLSFTEAAPGGGSNVATSVYVVSASLDGWHGINGNLPTVRRVTESPDGPHQVFRLDFYHNHVIKAPRNVIRVRGISNATAVA